MVLACPAVRIKKLLIHLPINLLAGTVICDIAILQQQVETNIYTIFAVTVYIGPSAITYNQIYLCQLFLVLSPTVK